VAAFLTVVTRHMPARWQLLERNTASLHAQSDPDYSQVTLVDELGSGFERANELLAMAAPMVTGRYVLILDDDDVMEAADGIAALKAAVVDNIGAHPGTYGPPAIIFRGRHADLGVLPVRSWQARPQVGDIGSFDFILRADVYREFARARGASAYAQDHALIEAVYDRHAPEIVWLDKVICAADRRRMGSTA